MKTKAGLGLVVVGIGVFAAWNLWTKTRNETPVDLPVSLIAGHTVTREFRLNLDGLYLIEFDAEKIIPLETLRCLMAEEPDAAQCKGIVPAIGASWVLSQDGQEVRRGNSLEPHSAPSRSDKVVHVIGEFPGEAGKDYQLQVTITSDGRSLEPAHPRLRVAVSSLARTDFQSAAVLVFSISFICVSFGVILLGIATFAASSLGAERKA